MTTELLTKNPQVMSTELPDGGSVLLDLSSELYFGLNSVGTQIWEYVGDGATATEIIDRLDAEYEQVDRATLTKDVTALVAELKERELLVGLSS